LQKFKDKKIMKHLMRFWLIFCCFLLIASSVQGASRPPEKKAIVLAAFGTSHVSALPGILQILDEVRRSFPAVPVRIAFTSSIIRRIWQDRRADASFLAAHPEVPPEIFQVKGPLATIADLQDEGYGYIIVQPTHLSSGEEFADLAAYVAAFNSIRTVKARNMPLRKVILGRPALGTHGIEHEYRRDLEEVVEVLAGEVEEARRSGRALVYLAHGNEHYSTGAYLELEYLLRQRFQEARIYVAMVEGFPGFDLLVENLERDGVKKVILKPFMVVAGEHARNDMAGPEPDSLKSILEKEGIEVRAELAGLGELAGFAGIFVKHIGEAAADEGISLE
jgi:sirohydrochlorin cobaltochelatase